MGEAPGRRRAAPTILTGHAPETNARGRRGQMVNAVGEPNQADRDRVIAALSDAFANGAIEVEELERRVAEAQHAATADQLARLWPGGRPGGALALRTTGEAAGA